MEIEILNIWDKIYPVGSIYITVNSTSPQTLFGGTWEKIEGRFLYGLDNENTGTGWEAKDTGGSNTTTLTIENLPPHNHSFSGTTSGTQAQAYMQLTYPSPLSDNWGNEGKILGGAPGNAWSTEAIATITGDSHTHTYSGTTSSIGSGKAINNMPAYFCCYMWYRVA